MNASEPSPSTSNDETVVIIDDEVGNRVLFEEILVSMAIPCRVYASAQAFFDSGEKNRIGCFVLDMRMPHISGLELHRRLLDGGFSQPVIFVTGHGDVSVAIQAMKDGAYDFIEKPVRTQQFIDAVQGALDERRQANERGERTAALERRFAELTERERQVLDLVLDGIPNRQIALQLDISSKTVEAHRASVMRKMDARSVPDLVRMSIALDPTRS